MPEKIDKGAVAGWLAKQPGVTSVHDLHIWPLSTTKTALTVHLVMPEGSPGDIFIDTVAHELEHRFSIEHATLQIERGDGEECHLAPANIV